MCLKHFLAHAHLLLRGEIAAPVRLEVHLIQVHVLLKKRDLFCQALAVRLYGPVRHKIGRQFKILVKPHSKPPR